MPEKFIVAIGSSAGGIDALKSFFDCTPHDRATYIVLTHLPVDYKSKLQKILQRHSNLVIAEATNDILIEKDTVYVTPASKYLTISNNRLYLHARPELKLQPNKAVDVFFESLAAAKGKLGIAVVLSGSGRDGTKGIGFVKQAGGMVIAQTPASCEFDSMPVHAIESGNADHVLLPSEMPHIILKHVSAMLGNTDLVNELKKIGSRH